MMHRFAPGLSLILLSAPILSCAGRPAATEYDVPPVLANRDEVRAALATMAGGLDAEVILLVRVTREGRVREVRVAESSGDEGIDDAAVWVGERMRFEPARHGGTPVPAWVRVPVTFDVVSPAVRPPRLLNADAIAAAMARDHPGLEGTARLRLRVGDEGEVKRIRQRWASGRDVLDAARALAEQLEFQPAVKGFERVEDWVVCVFEFSGQSSSVRLEES